LAGLRKESALQLAKRISRYELGVHEPPLPTVRLIAEVLDVPLSYLYCEDDRIALLLLELHRLDSEQLTVKVEMLLQMVAAG
jgi:transcriptional regulator with XRE-family HTH domain